MHKGMSSAPDVGPSGNFKGGMFVETHADWAQVVSGAKTITPAHEKKLPNAAKTYSIRKDGFVYLYAVSGAGELASVAFTHEVIASKGGRIPATT